MIPRIRFHQLLAYPEMEWGCAASGAWIELCEALRAYERKLAPQPFPLSRKWELVSALQKVIRRGDQSVAVQLIAKIEGMRPEEHAYFWRRLSVIACEDVGAGQEDLTLFVVACSQVFTPIKSQGVLLGVFAFLIERLCAATHRSRTACTIVSVTEMLSTDASLTALNRGDRVLLEEVEDRVRRVNGANLGFRAWQRRNGWRTAGLLKFVDLVLPCSVVVTSSEPPPFTELHGLPSFSYDMYTRSGRAVLSRLVQGVQGAIEISNILSSRRGKDPLAAAGEALFFAEGGYVAGEIEYAELADLHHRAFATRFGLQLSEWVDLRTAMRRVVENGTITALRAEELGIRYAQTELFLA